MTDEKKNLFASDWGNTPEEAQRKAALKFLQAKFKRTGDMATLAEIAELDPPAGDEAVGAEIASVLLNKNPDKKAYRDTFWRDLDRVFDFLQAQGHSVAESYAKVAEIFFPDDEHDDTKGVEDIRKQHKRWLKKAGQNF